MNVLILYETMEGQTGKIARFALEQVRALGHDGVLVDAGKSGTLSLEGVDAVILAAPVHQRRHPREFEALVAARRAELAERRVLMISVSLSAAFPEGQEEAEDYLVEMKMRTGLKPDAELLAGGAVRMSEYDYFARQVVRFVVLRGREYDANADELEFTDWDAVSEAVKGFLAA